MTRILVINDFHTGSMYSMCSPEVKISLSEDNGADHDVYHKANEVQSAIYETYISMCNHLKPLDGVILNGDMTEGWNPKGKATELWTAEIRAQVIEAVNLIEKLPITKKTWFRITYSSGYHTGHNPSSDEILYQELIKRGYTDTKIGYDMALQVNDMRIHACHSIGVAQNKTTSLTKELEWAMLNQKDYGEIDIVLRAHCHYASHVYREDKYGWIVPGWKSRDEYVASRGLRYNPKIGALFLDIPETGKEFTYHFYEWGLKYPLRWEVVE